MNTFNQGCICLIPMFKGQYITVYKCLDEYFNYPRHVICRDIINEQIGSTLTEEFQVLILAAFKHGVPALFVHSK